MADPYVRQARGIFTGTIGSTDVTAVMPSTLMTPTGNSLTRTTIRSTPRRSPSTVPPLERSARLLKAASSLTPTLRTPIATRTTSTQRLAA